jgi:hypothetical protein
MGGQRSIGIQVEDDLAVLNVVPKQKLRSQNLAERLGRPRVPVLREVTLPIQFSCSFGNRVSVSDVGNGET